MKEGYWYDQLHDNVAQFIICIGGGRYNKMDASESDLQIKVNQLKLKVKTLNLKGKDAKRLSGFKQLKTASIVRNRILQAFCTGIKILLVVGAVCLTLAYSSWNWNIPISKKELAMRWVEDVHGESLTDAMCLVKMKSQVK